MSARPLRIAIDARPLAFPGTGNATYLYRMLTGLFSLRPEDDWVFLSHRGVHASFADLLSRSSVEMVTDQSLASRLAGGPGFMQRRVRGLVEEHDCDLFWGTLAMLPYDYQRSSVPAIVNFHDLNAVVAPETMVRWKRWQHRMLDARSLANARIVLCLSDTTRNDIRKHMPDVAAEKLRVVYPGLSPRVEPQRPERELPEGFILSVGTIEPRKNHGTLIEGFRKARAKSGIGPLVLVGRRGWAQRELSDWLEGPEAKSEGVIYLNDASDAELSWCYANAAFLALPSLHEGFGLPVIEAHQAGCPTILSDIPIFREIGGSSRFVPARDTDAWSAALLEAWRAFEQGVLEKPSFDAEFWSWQSRAGELSAIIDEVTAPA